MSLDLNNLVRLSTKILGLVFLIFAATNLAQYSVGFIEVVRSGDIGLMWAGFLIPTFVYLVIGLMLWLFPKPVANTIVTGSTEINNSELEIAAVSVVGIVFFILGISDLIYHIVFYIDLSDLLKRPQWVPSRGTNADILGSATQMILGIALIIRGGTIVKVIQDIRYQSRR